jgi:DNA gyrase subunit A
LPLAAPQARGKALVNLLPLEEGERITTIMPLPADETTWANLDVMFATTRGTVRRNKLSDFVEVRQNGKIAMKLEDGDGIVGVETCMEMDDVLLTTAKGQAIRFKVTDVRVFAGRNSVGVRGINLADGDEVISMTVLRGFAATSDERVAYVKMRRAMEGDDGEAGDVEDEATADAVIDQERYIQMGAAEQFILTLSENGFGKRSSAYEYRVTGRGGKGITAMAVNDRNGDLVASFPIEETDQIMLVTDGGQLIRCPVNDIRIAGRSTQGVTVFRTGKEENVVSVSRISEDVNGDDDDEDEDRAEGDGPAPDNTPDDQPDDGAASE